MNIQELTSLPTGRKAIEDFEELAENSPDIYFSLANTKQPVSPEELSSSSSYGDRFKGLNLEMDCCDSLEVEELWAFTNIEYLKLNFTDCSINERDFSSFQNWLLELTELKAVVLSTPPKDNEYTKIIMESLSVNKPYPLTVIYQTRVLGKKSRSNAGNDNLYIHAGNANIYQATKVTLDPKGIKDIIQNAKKLSTTQAKELHYSGHLEVEGGEWVIDVKSLYVDEFKELVISLEGSDEDGRFSSMCRLNWLEEEGGFYFASRVPIDYVNYRPDSETISIKIKTLMIGSMGECHIQGSWLQVGEEWAIDGELTKVSTTKIIEKLAIS